ncbi:MAG: hypothetical protein J1F18_06400 [Lachnospiraceae bacterium]|nr:hypothetical protein [Lachnospiraceae bacterium]
MRKRIHLFLMLLLSVLCFNGCGKQEKVSDKKFEMALDIYQEYYNDLLSDAEECYIQVFLDAEGFPAIMTAIPKYNSYRGEDMLEVEISTIVKGEVYSLYEDMFAVNSEEPTMGMPDYTDNYRECVVYSDGIVGIFRDNEKEWYQIRGENLEEVACYDLYSGIVTFYVDKEKIEIDLLEENPLVYEKEYDKICKSLYGRTGTGEAYGKKVWLQKFLGTAGYDQPVFMQSPSVGWLSSMFDSTTSKRMFSKLKQSGSMTNDEYLIWHYNYLVDIGGDSIWELPSASGLIFRDPMLLNQIDDYMLGDKGLSQIYLLSYLTSTGDWKAAEKIELFGEFDREQLVSWQLLCLFLRMEDILTEEQRDYDEYLRYAGYYLSGYLHLGIIDPETQLDDFYRGWSYEVERGERSVEDLLLLSYVESKTREEYAAQTDGKEGVKYIELGEEYIDGLPRRIAAWEEEYIGSEQMERDYEEYIRDQYAAFIEEGNSYIERNNVDSRDIGYIYVKIGDSDIPSLIRYSVIYDYTDGEGWTTAVDVLAYSDNKVNEYHLAGAGIRWFDEKKSIFMFCSYGMHTSTDVIWTLKNGKGYIKGAKMTSFSADYQEYFIFEGELDKEADLYTYLYSYPKDEILGPEQVEVSEERYREAFREYFGISTYNDLEMNYPLIREPNPTGLSYNLEDKALYVESYTTIEEAFDSWRLNPDGGLETQVSVYERAKSTDHVVAGESTSADAEPVEKPVLDIVVEDEVTQIRAWYNETQNNLDSYASFSASDGGVVCYKDQELSRLDAGKGFDDWNYTRRYYFRNGSLYFAFVFDGNEEHRLYFKEDQLIRYIDEKKNTYDYGDTDRFSVWSVPVLSEAYRLYDGFEF